MSILSDLGMSFESGTSAELNTSADLARLSDTGNPNTSTTTLLQRSIPAAVIKERTAQLRAPLTQADQLNACSVLVFRLGQEWFALSADLCRQVLSPLVAHTLPHRSNSTLLGIVNVRGQMLLKVSFLAVLGLSATDASPLDGMNKEKQLDLHVATKVYPRMVVIEKNLPAGHSDVWAFDVDELDGIHSISIDTLESPAAGVQTSPATCTRRVFLWQKRRVSLLDETQLFDALRRRAL